MEFMAFFVFGAKNRANFILINKIDFTKHISIVNQDYCFTFMRLIRYRLSLVNKSWCV